MKDIKIIKADKKTKAWYKKTYGLEAKEIHMSSDLDYEIYLRLVEDMVKYPKKWKKDKK